MAIRIQCPVCGKAMQADDEWAGRAAKCPTCGETVKVPGEPPAPPIIVTGPTRARSAGRNLRTCKHCRGAVSPSARACPHCGAQRTPELAKIVIGFGLALMAVVVLFVAVAVLTSEPGETRPAFVPDPAKQKEREQFVAQLIREGVFSKVEMPGTTPHVWVAPKFYLLNFDDKESFCSATYGLFFPDPNDTASGHHIRLNDSLSGKKIGTYSPLSGLDLD